MVAWVALVAVRWGRSRGLLSTEPGGKRRERERWVGDAWREVRQLLSLWVSPGGKGVCGHLVKAGTRAHT